MLHSPNWAAMSLWEAETASQELPAALLVLFRRPPSQSRSGIPVTLRGRDSFIYALRRQSLFCYVPWLHFCLICTKATGDWLITSWLCRRTRQKGTLMKNRDWDMIEKKGMVSNLSANSFTSLLRFFFFLSFYCMSYCLSLCFFYSLSFLPKVNLINIDFQMLIALFFNKKGAKVQSSHRTFLIT